MPPIAKDCGINSINIQLTQLRSGLYWEVRRPAAPPHLIDTTAFPRIALRAAEPHPRQSTSSYRLFVLPEYLATRSSDARSHSEEKRAGPGRDSQTRRDSRFRNCDIYAVYELKSEDKPFSEILMGDIQTSHQYSPAVPISRTLPLSPRTLSAADRGSRRSTRVVGGSRSPCSRALGCYLRSTGSY